MSHGLLKVLQELVELVIDVAKVLQTLHNVANIDDMLVIELQDLARFDENATKPCGFS